jgi:hypothetical protein
LIFIILIITYLEVDHCVIKDVTIDIPKRRRGRPRKHPIRPEIADNRNINDELWPNETVDIRKDTESELDIYYFNYNVFRS